MRDKLCVCERRMKILDLLRVNEQMTRLELANEFDVSVDTIARDIIYLSRIAPISARRGNNGGIYIDSKFKKYTLYLTDNEESCLRSLMNEVNQEEKETIRNIVIKFTKNIAAKNQNTQ